MYNQRQMSRLTSDNDRRDVSKKLIQVNMFTLTSCNLDQRKSDPPSIERELKSLACVNDASVISESFASSR